MSTETARNFCSEIDEIRGVLRALPEAVAERPWRPGGWTGKQILGHLLDSAANNRQRFVRAGIEGNYKGPEYAQEAWVAAHEYTQQSWSTLLRWWEVEHEILAAAVNAVPEERLEAICVVEGNAPVTLGFLIQDYVRHQRWHLAQLNAAAAEC